MKRIILLVTLLIVGLLSSCCDTDVKHNITDAYSNTYCTNTYTEKGTCIEFIDCSEKKIIICGSYTIREN